MPRPTVAQFAYGSCAVILSTFALLLLSGTSSGAGVAAVAVVALALGLVVAVRVPVPASRRPAAARPADAAPGARHGAVPVPRAGPRAGPRARGVLTHRPPRVKAISGRVAEAAARVTGP